MMSIDPKYTIYKMNIIQIENVERILTKIKFK